MATKSQRTLQDRMAGVRRFAVALGNDPTEWEPDDLVTLQLLEGVIREVRTKAVLGLRSTGYTDGEIASALGITQQAVSKRWPGGGKYQGAAGRYRSVTTTQEAAPA